MRRLVPYLAPGLTLAGLGVLPAFFAYQGLRPMRGRGAEAALIHGRWLAAVMELTVFFLLTSYASRLARRRCDSAGPTRLAKVMRHGRFLTLLLLLVGLCTRLLWLSADSPAFLLTHSGAFDGDEGVWSYLATSWCQRYDPIGGPEYLGGALALPYTAMQYLSCRLAGVSLWAVRLGPALLGSLTGVVGYLGLRRMLPAAAAFAAGALLATSYWLIMYQRTAMLDGTLAVLCLLSVLMWLRASSASSVPAIFVSASLAGVVLGLTLWFKISALPIAAAVVASAAYAAMMGRRRAALTALAGAAVGMGAVGLVAACIYTAWPALAKAALHTLAVNGVESKASPQLWRAVRLNPTLVHAPFTLTVALLGLWAVATGVRERAYRDNIAVGIAALTWLLATTVMLALRGYMPPRYFLPSYPAVVMLAAVGITHVWRHAPQLRQAWPLRAAVVSLVLAQVLFCGGRWAAWAYHPPHSLLTAAARISKVANADVAAPRVSSPASFTLALAGSFRPMGFRVGHHPTPAQALREGATHVLAAVPMSSDWLDELHASGGTARLRAELTYNRKSLGLYRVTSGLLEDGRAQKAHAAQPIGQGSAQDTKTVGNTAAKIDR